MLVNRADSHPSAARFVGLRAVVPDSLAVKDLPAKKKLDKIIARNFDFGNNPKNTSRPKCYFAKD
jgi:hypothetical protein